MNKSVNKKSRVLLIFGIITLIISLLFLGIFTDALIKQIVYDNFASAIGLVFTIIFYLIPGIIVSMLSFLFNTLAYKKSDKPAPVVYKICFTLSGVIPLIYFIEFIMLYII